jgi:pimeloyl-ACP methyl ester carboxylesterase
VIQCTLAAIIKYKKGDTLIPELRAENLDGVDLPYLSYDGRGTPLILLHATGFLAALWHPVARALSPMYSIIAPHIVDYRPADPEKGGLSWITIARDIAAFCEKTHIKNPYLVGHSMGGAIGLLLAAAWPDRLERLVAYPARHPKLEVCALRKDRLVLICHPDHPLSKLKVVKFKAGKALADKVK